MYPIEKTLLDHFFKVLNDEKNEVYMQHFPVEGQEQYKIIFKVEVDNREEMIINSLFINSIEFSIEPKYR